MDGTAGDQREFTRSKQTRHAGITAADYSPSNGLRIPSPQSITEDLMSFSQRDWSTSGVGAPAAADVARVRAGRTDRNLERPRPGSKPQRHSRRGRDSRQYGDQ